MKKHIILSLFLCLCAAFVSLSAQEKVVDKSAKKRPVWASGSAQDYIIGFATAGDLETAKNQALEDVRKQIIRAVAENISFASQGSTQQKMENSDITMFVDNFESKYKTQAASLPYITGISSSKIEESYWEKLQDKQTKAISYLYSVKYPLPAGELRKMILAFEKQDREMYQKYTELEKQLTQVSSLEEIDGRIAELNPLIEYFFDDVRKNAARSLQQRYRDLYKNISFKVFSNKLGDHRFGLVLNGRPISTSQRIQVKSDDIYDVNVEPTGDEIVVKYQFDGAEYDRMNEVTVNVKMGGRTVPHKFSFIVRKAGIKLYPQKTVYLTAATKNDSIVGLINIRIPMKSEYSTPYTIRNITLTVPGLANPLFIDGINFTSSRKEDTFILDYDDEMEVLRLLKGQMDMVKGSMDIEIPAEEIDTRIDFSLPVKTNW
ncbi:hypothetical protein D0T87_00495 [Bacteroides sp. 51]|nr:hypothetical protein [Bacteroides sp. 51]